MIMTNAELLQSAEYDAEKRTNFLQGIVTMSGQMRNLIEQMLELVRSESAEDVKAFRDVDWSRLVQYETMSFESVFFEKELSLSADIDESVHVHGDEEQLRQVIDVLLDNACKYSREKGNARVELHKQGKNHCVLRVSNQGAALSKEELEQIFRRFYRTDPARSRDGSFGLGLSIAESIVKQHQGKIWAESQNGWNHFSVILSCV